MFPVNTYIRTNGFHLHEKKYHCINSKIASKMSDDITRSFYK